MALDGPELAATVQDAGCINANNHIINSDASAQRDHKPVISEGHNSLCKFSKDCSVDRCRCTSFTAMSLLPVGEKVPQSVDAPPLVRDLRKDDEEKSKPFAIDLFSGPRAPVASALAWCGWRVVPVDTKLNSSHDLADTSFQTILG